MKPTLTFCLAVAAATVKISATIPVAIILPVLIISPSIICNDLSRQICKTLVISRGKCFEASLHL
jgi:hypothetical protein